MNTYLNVQTDGQQETIYGQLFLLENQLQIKRQSGSKRGTVIKISLNDLEWQVNDCYYGAMRWSFGYQGKTYQIFQCGQGLTEFLATFFEQVA